MVSLFPQRNGTSLVTRPEICSFLHTTRLLTATKVKYDECGFLHNAMVILIWHLEHRVFCCCTDNGFFFAPKFNDSDFCTCFFFLHQLRFFSHRPRFFFSPIKNENWYILTTSTSFFSFTDYVFFFLTNI